jgi:hypothetical protein
MLLAKTIEGYNPFSKKNSRLSEISPRLRVAAPRT